MVIGIIGMVCGILSTVLSFVSMGTGLWLAIVAAILGLAAIILSAIGMGKAKQEGKTKAFGIVGLIFGIVGLIFSIVSVACWIGVKSVTGVSSFAEAADLG